MGRKRRVGAIPSPLVPSLSRSSPAAHRSPERPKAVRHDRSSRCGGRGKGNNTNNSEAILEKEPRSKNRERGEAREASPAMLVGVSREVSAGGIESTCGAPITTPAVLEIDHPVATSMRKKATTPTRLSRMISSGSQLSEIAASSNVSPTPIGKCVMTPSDVLDYFMPRSGWKLRSCWGPNCHCTVFDTSTTTATATSMLENSASAMLCSCGHRSVAHELVDESMKHSSRPGSPWVGDGFVLKSDGARISGSIEAARLRKLFSAIRNARAIGDCGLFEDSEGINSWGAGWFLSRYLKEAREAATELGQALHDPSTIAHSLSVAERLMSGDSTRSWSMPDSLPSSSIYKVLGMGIASELDLAYWHVRYSAASKFQASDVTSSASFVVPPPEVYFVCLACHLPPTKDLRAFLRRANPAQRRMMENTFDLRLDAWDCEDTPCSSAHELEFPVLTNPLLAVAQATWLETAISAEAESWVPHFPPKFDKPEGTMRGSDPAMPPPIRARCDVMRDWSARLYAFAVPNNQAIETCRRAVGAYGGPRARVVEVGAGLGYWKWVLEGAGTSQDAKSSKSMDNFQDWKREGKRHRFVSDNTGGQRTKSAANSKSLTTKAHIQGPSRVVLIQVLALDRDPTQFLHSSPKLLSGHYRYSEHTEQRSRAKGRVKSAGALMRSNEYHGGAPAWAEVKAGSPENLRSLNVEDYPVLFLCYPPPSLQRVGDGGRCMGADALEAFGGKVLLYVGEIGGDTGSPRLETMLQEQWDLVEEVELPCFSSTANILLVFVRKGFNFKTPKEAACVFPLYRCSGCGRSSKDELRLYQCRLTRAVRYCSSKCLHDDADRWRANLEVRHIHLTSRGRGVSGVGDTLKVFRDKKRFRTLNPLALGPLV